MSDADTEARVNREQEAVILEYVRKGYLGRFDKSKYQEIQDEVYQIVQRNGIPMPRILMVKQELITALNRGIIKGEANNLLANSVVAMIPEVKDCIFLNEKVIDEALQDTSMDISQKNIADWIMHDIAHFYTTSREVVGTKTNEYITDRTAAALIGNAQRYKRSLEKMIDFSETLSDRTRNSYLQEIAEADNLDEKTKSELTDHVNKEVGRALEESRRIYGTKTERLANIQYDINRCNEGFSR